MKRTLIAAIRHTRAAHSLECGLALKNLPGKSCVFEATGHSRAAQSSARIYGTHRLSSDAHRLGDGRQTVTPDPLLSRCMELRLP
jgi:hypothetical protein